MYKFYKLKNRQLDEQAMGKEIYHCRATSTFLHVNHQEHYLGDTLKMNASPSLVIVVLLMLGKAQGDSVTQMEGQMTISERTSLTINCTYSATGYPALFWYVQYPGEGPQLLLKATKANEKGSNKEFEATYDKDKTSFHLKKASVQESDSAVYYCALSDTATETAGGAEHKLQAAQRTRLL
ncbi:T cell receptor alpha variable 9-2, partial [Tupaia chinensis]|uniref:T cell receptor alpha variable 9-2 n=1 Tax=Tupaia chinensis TaxID=246437 RepID=UPI000FFB5A60